MFPTQTVMGGSSWPVTQTWIYLKAYPLACGPHTVLPLSVWLWCRYWSSPSSTASSGFICWIINSSGLSRKTGNWKGKSNDKTQGAAERSRLDSPTYYDTSVEQAPFVTARALGKKAKRRLCVFIHSNTDLFSLLCSQFTWRKSSCEFWG